MFLHLMTLSAMANPTLAERANGTFSSVDAASAVSGRREEAIERTLEPMNFALAMLARGKLEDSLAVCGSYKTTLADNTFSLTCDNRPTVTTVIGGSASNHTTEKGDTYLVTSTQEGESIVNVVFTGDSGAQTTRFDFSGEILVVTKIVTSDMLEVPLTCSFNYR